MEYYLIKKKYKEYGKSDYKLRSIQDIKLIHEIKIDKIKGIGKLTLSRDLFEEFLVNFFNAHGLEARNTIKPLSVKCCKDKDNGNYLRFDYKMHGSNTWLHVKGEHTWY